MAGACRTLGRRRTGIPGRRALLLAAAAGLLAGGVAPTVATAAGPTVSLAPIGATGAKGYFIYTARPGARIRGQAALVNTTGARGRVLLYAVDATTGQTSGAVYLSRARPRHDVGAWTRLPVGRVVLGSHGRARIAFTIHVPRRARGGQHLGAIVAEPVTALRRYSGKKNGHAFHINVRALTVLAVQVDVPARPVQRMSVRGCRVGGPHGYQTLFIGMGNTGNQFLRGSGSLTVTGAGGRLLKRRTFALDTFLPGTAISYPVVLTGKPLGAGRYGTAVSVTYGDGHRLVRRLTCNVTRRSVVQVFGVTNAAQISPARGASGPSALVLVIAGVALLGLGFGAAMLLNRRAHQG